MSERPSLTSNADTGSASGRRLRGNGVRRRWHQGGVCGRLAFAVAVSALLLASACGSSEGPEPASPELSAPSDATAEGQSSATTSGDDAAAEPPPSAAVSDSDSANADADDAADSAQPTASTDDESGDATVPAAAPGTVVVAAGDAVQIRTVSVMIANSVGERDYPEIVKVAIDDFGLIHGSFPVDSGEALDDPCSAFASPQVGAYFEANQDLIGIIGPSCSATASAIAPIIDEAGMVMVSATNTSPELTSDLAGNAGKHNRPGYYRTAHNDLYAGAAIAAFLDETFGPQRTAVVHQGDTYTLGLAQAFRNSYEPRDGSISHFVDLGVDTTEVATPEQVADAVAGIAADTPDALFFVLYRESAEVFLGGLSDHGGFGETVIVAGDTARYPPLMAQEHTKGMFISGPDNDHTGNVNQATGASVSQASERFTAATGAPPSRSFWTHAYDAATLLLEAIEAASTVENGSLVIDRAAIREHLSQVDGFEGLSGTLSCDRFGDCGAGKITIIEHIDPADVEASLNNVVYRYTRQSSTP